MELGLFKLQVIYYTKQVLSAFWLKFVVGVLMAALLPHALALQGLCVLFGIDFVCGVWVAKRMHKLSSAGMRRGVSKLLIYAMFVCSVAITEHFVLDTNGLTYAALGLLAVTELLSITENLVMLGMPIPYAANILRLVSNKASNFGVNISTDPDTFTTLRDMVNLMEDEIPSFHNKQLRTMLEVYVSAWYEFSHDLADNDLGGNVDLVRERLHNQVNRMLIDIRSLLSRESIQTGTQDLFLNQWNKNLLARLVFTIDTKVADSNASNEDKADAIREAIALMLYRLVKEVRVLDTTDLTSTTPLDEGTPT